MTPSEAAFRRVTIEAFRGFRDRQEFDISTWAVIISGPNGTGKTSLFDALQWVLVGKIERLEGVRARRNVEHIVNQYRLGERAVVEVEMSVQGRQFRLRRTGDHNQSTLEYAEEGEAVLFGQEAEERLEQVLVPHQGVTLQMALTTSGLLQQDVMRAVLEAKPAERYRHISTVLGLHDLEDFEEAVKSAAKDAGDLAEVSRKERDTALRSLEAARAQLERVKDQQLSRVPVESVLTEVRDMIGRAPQLLTVVLEDESLRSASDASEFAREAARVHGWILEVLDKHTAFQEERQRLTPEPDVEAQSSAKEAAEEAERLLQDSEEARTLATAELAGAEHASEELARLAATAIPLLSTVCPVCRQAINPVEVEQELRLRADASERLLQLRQSVDESAARVAAARLKHESALAAATGTRSARNAWAAVRAREEQLDREVEGWAAQADKIRVTVSNAGELASIAEDLLAYLTGLRGRLIELADVLQQGATAGQVERSAAEVGSFEAALANRSQRHEELAQQASLLKRLF